MSYHPKNVADYGTRHGYDLTRDVDRAEVAEKFTKSREAPAGIGERTVLAHLEAFVKGEPFGLYMPDGTTRETVQKGGYGEQCFTSSCILTARWIPTGPPKIRDAGNYYCESCCEAITSTWS